MLPVTSPRAVMDAELLPHLAFAAAAERSSFTAAAKAVGVSQAAVSQRIHRLEILLRTPLFRREGPGAAHRCWAAAYDYTPYPRPGCRRGGEAVTSMPVEVAGELRVAASSVPGQHLLPHFLAAFRERYPLVRVRVTVSDTEVALREVEHGRAHLGLVGGRGNGPNLEFRLTSDELVLVVPKRHPWWRRSAPADLAAQPLIQRERGSASRGCFEQSLERAGTDPSTLNVVLELGSGEAIKEAILEGVGVAVLSRRAVRADVRAGRLRPVPVDRLTLGRDISAVWTGGACCPRRPGSS